MNSGHTGYAPRLVSSKHHHRETSLQAPRYRGGQRRRLDWMGWDQTGWDTCMAGAAVFLIRNACPPTHGLDSRLSTLVSRLWQSHVVVASHLKLDAAIPRTRLPVQSRTHPLILLRPLFRSTWCIHSTYQPVSRVPGPRLFSSKYIHTDLSPVCPLPSCLVSGGRLWVAVRTQKGLSTTESTTNPSSSA